MFLRNYMESLLNVMTHLYLKIWWAVTSMAATAHQVETTSESTVLNVLPCDTGLCAAGRHLVTSPVLSNFSPSGCCLTDSSSTKNLLPHWTILLQWLQPAACMHWWPSVALPSTKELSFLSCKFYGRLSASMPAPMMGGACVSPSLQCMQIQGSIIPVWISIREK